ncbi:hypothetical protein BGZ82_000804 [Podila clonocystis]|nr:hypothetical protein BGZ82_000804 [Podila clonocystis]
MICKENEACLTIMHNILSVVYLKHPTEFPVAGEHLAVQTNLNFKPVLKDGEILTRNLVISLDPYLPFHRIIPNARETNLPLSSYVGVLGEPELTAWASLKDIGKKPMKGETIFISAASGAVGQLAGQLCKAWGMTVIGSVGSDDKGIDIYFDCVGGQTLEAALDHLNNFGRIIACGMIAQYNTCEPYGIKNLMNVIGKSLTIHGFISSNYHAEYFANFFKDVREKLLKKQIVYRVDEAQGIGSAPEAFVGMLGGKNFGKAVVHIADL